MKASCWILCLKKSATTFGEGCMYNPSGADIGVLPVAQCHGCWLFDDVIKWKHLPRYWPFFAGNSPVTGEVPAQRSVTRSFDVFFDLRLNNSWVNSREAGDLRRHCDHYYLEWNSSLAEKPLLLISWLLMSPAHQQLRYWRCKINGPFSFREENF